MPGWNVGSASAQSGPALVIRGRTKADLDECVAILAQVHRRDGYPLHWPPDPAGWLTPRTLLSAWVAAHDGQVAGHIVLSWPASGDAAPGLRGPGASSAGVVMVSRLFVSPAARGHAAGAALINQAVRAAAERGLRPMLDVHTANTSAIALYERLGWHLLGTSEAQWGSRLVTVRCYEAPA